MNQNGGSRTETLVKLVLIFVISLLSFSVGTFVGKQFSDSQHKMASLEQDYGHSPKREAASEDALTDEDIANLTQEFVDAEKQGLDLAEKAGAANAGALEQELMNQVSEILNDESPANEEATTSQIQKPAETVAAQAVQKSEEVSAKTKSVAKTPEAEPKKMVEAPSKNNSKLEKTAERVASGKAPQKNTPKSRIPSSLPATAAASSIGKYTVQIASYSTENDAQAHAQRLIDSGLSAFYLSADIKGAKWYRVSVGLFGSRKGAKEYQKKLVNSSKVSSAIVQKIVK